MRQALHIFRKDVRQFWPQIVLVASLYWSRAFERLYVQSLTQRLEREARLAAAALPWTAAGPELDRQCAAHAREIGRASCRERVFITV